MRDTNTSFLHDDSILPQPLSVDKINYAQVPPLPSPATPSSSSGELHLYIESDTSTPSIPVRPLSSSHELVLQGDQPMPQLPPILRQSRTQQTPDHNHQPNIRVSPLGLMRLPEQNNQVALRLKRSFQFGHTLAGFVDLDHGLNHWCFHNQQCPHPFHNDHVYLHHGMAQPFHLSDHRYPFHNQPLRSTDIDGQLSLHRPFT